MSAPHPLNQAVIAQALHDLRNGQLRRCKAMGFGEEELDALKHPELVSMLVNATVSWCSVSVNRDVLKRLLSQVHDVEREIATVDRMLRLGASTEMVSRFYGLTHQEVALRRDPKTGRILSNLYVLHDEPLTPFEAMQLDPDYLGLVSQALTHAAKAVQIVGMNTLREIAEDPMLNGRTLPTRLQVLAQRMARNEWADASYPQAPVDHESEEGQDGLLRNLEGPSSESEAGLKSAPDGSLRNPKEDRTVRMDRINQVRTVPRAKSLQHLRLPERLLRLKDEQQSGAMVALQQVDESLRQAVLDEWDARCRNSAVRNPAGYLFGIIQKAIRGEFKAWAGEGGSPSTPPAPPPRPAAPAPSAPPPPAPNGPGREAARAYLAKLRSTLGDS